MRLEITKPGPPEATADVSLRENDFDNFWSSGMRECWELRNDNGVNIVVLFAI